MPKSLYKGGKQRRHFTLSSDSFDHLSLIAEGAKLSRSETLERLIRSTAISEGSMLLSNTSWHMAYDCILES